MTSTLIAEILVGAAALLFFVALYGAREITRIPVLPVPATPKEFKLDYESWRVPTSRGLTLNLWWVPAKSRTEKTVLILHGVGSNAGDMLPSTAFLRRDGGWNLAYLDFRGHGLSEGRWTSLGALELDDARAALSALREKKPEETRQLALYGHSMGGAVAIVAAAQDPHVAGVVVENTFADIRRTIRRFAWMFYRIPEFPFLPLALGLARWRTGAPVGEFRPVDWIGQISPRPLLLLHGELDRRMPKTDVRALWDAAGEPKELWTIPQAGHGDAWLVMKDDYEKRLTEFYRRVFGETA